MFSCIFFCIWAVWCNLASVTVTLSLLAGSVKRRTCTWGHPFLQKLTGEMRMQTCRYQCVSMSVSTGIGPQPDCQKCLVTVSTSSVFLAVLSQLLRLEISESLLKALSKGWAFTFIFPSFPPPTLCLYFSGGTDASYSTSSALEVFD